MKIENATEQTAGTRTTTGTGGKENQDRKENHTKNG